MMANMDKVRQHFGEGGYLFHGSRSASLLTFTNSAEQNQGALIPTGQLLKSGKVPFSGEMGNALYDRSFNTDHLSSVDTENFSDACYYSRFVNPDAWNLEQQTEKLGKLKEELKKMPVDNTVNSLYQIHQQQIDLAEKRIAQWGRMTQEQQSLVTENFSVIYVLDVAKTGDRLKYANSEIGIKNGVSASEINTIMVDEANVSRVQALLKGMTGTQDIQVISTESFLVKDEAPTRQTDINNNQQQNNQQNPKKQIQDMFR